MNTNSNTRKRKLSKFIAHEMLAEYVLNQLDPDRSRAMDEAFKSEPDLLLTKNQIELQLKYLDEMKGAQISDAVMNRLRLSESPFSLFQKYLQLRNWPESVRWPAAAVAISIFVAFLFTAIPWQKFPMVQRQQGKTVFLADLPAPTKPSQDAVAPVLPDSDAIAESGDLEGSGDEDVALDPKLAEIAANAKPFLGKNGMGAHDDEEVVDVSHPLPNANVTATATPAVPAQVVATAPTPAYVFVGPPSPSREVLTARRAAEATATIAAESKPSDPKAQGLVYRADLNVEDLDVVTGDLITFIESNGGQKAGQVPLGWRKESEGLSYFHFIFPQTNEQALIEKMRSFGPVRISKDPHPRVMPEGQLRFILSVYRK